MAFLNDDHARSVASFALPRSPAHGPMSSEKMAIWIQDPSKTPALPAMPWANACPQTDHPSEPSPPRLSSALVPFQKLQVDTNLHATTLPVRKNTTTDKSAFFARPRARGGLTSSSAQGHGHPATIAATSSVLNTFPSTSSPRSLEVIHALKLHDDQATEPQLSVRVRGHRVELTSAGGEEEVDFLGPAEHIKRLFKLPYSQSRVSLAVHRVGTTLVVDGELDETDVPAGFFEDLPQETRQLVPQADETLHKLLYEKFIYESTVNTSLPGSDKEARDRLEDTTKPEQIGNTIKKKHGRKTKKARKKKQTQETLETATGTESQDQEQKSSKHVALVSAAQHDDDGGKRSNSVSSRSVPGSASSWTTETESRIDGDTQHEIGSSPSSRQKPCPPFIPTEKSWFTPAAQHSQAYGDSQTFQRILKWKFNDLKMMLGSQVLLFSNKEHPAVSLKLHDMDKELSLCTVLDYYLDNVIANIPELAICMHSKGLVRGYKLVETRKIPYMSGSGRPLFDVQDVSMNASMLLKFLQENCSRPNGTYWLHRKEGETSLRLYDVDVLSQGGQLKWKYMMAMLCYRFAARASRLSSSLPAGTPHLQQQLQQRQRELLRTCMSLLGEIAQKGGTAHSSICSSVSEQLADTYLRECNQFHSSNPTESAPESDSNREAAIGSLEKAKQYLLASIILFEESIPQDSGSALTHSDDGTDGAAAIESEGELAPEDGDGDDEMGSFMDEELDRLQLKFSSACLELGHLYASSHKWIDAVKCMVEASQFLTLSSVPCDVQPFDLTSREQEVAFDSLLDNLDFDGVGRGGFSQNRITICISGAELRCSLLGLIGDVAAQRPVTVYGGLTTLYDIVSGAKRDQLLSLRDNANEFLTAFKEDVASLDNKALASREEGLLLLSFLAYLHALSPPASSELFFMMMKKLGNASNELGKYFLAVKSNYKEAFRWFERGCKIFNDIEDGINVALLRANLAHLHKIFAQGKSTDSREKHYRTAIQLCTEALQLLKQSKADVDLNRKVKGELALTYLVWAVDLANHTSSLDTTGRSSTKARENETLKMFNKALTLYAELSDRKQSASTHYQIASFYSRMISTMLQHERESAQVDKPDGSSSTLTSRMEIARRHYEKALHYFGAVEVGKTYVLIHQELADLHILGGHFESIEHALLILLNTYEAFNVASTRDAELETEEMTSLARDIMAKVKAVLHQLIRLCSDGRLSISNGARSKKLEMFKKMYKEVIYNADSIVSILGTLRRMYSNCSTHHSAKF